MAASQEIPALKEIGGKLALPPGGENGVRPQQPGESEVRDQDHPGEDLTIQDKGLNRLLKASCTHSPTMPGVKPPNDTRGHSWEQGLSHLWPIPPPPHGRSEEFDRQLGVRLGLPGSAGAKERVNPEVPE